VSESERERISFLLLETYKQIYECMKGRKRKRKKVKTINEWKIDTVRGLRSALRRRGAGVVEVKLLPTKPEQKNKFQANDT
jgi:hypothetical protein